MPIRTYPAQTFQSGMDRSREHMNNVIRAGGPRKDMEDHLQRVFANYLCV